MAVGSLLPALQEKQSIIFSVLGCSSKPSKTPGCSYSPTLLLLVTVLLSGLVSGQATASAATFDLSTLAHPKSAQSEPGVQALDHYIEFRESEASTSPLNGEDWSPLRFRGKGLGPLWPHQDNKRVDLRVKLHNPLPQPRPFVLQLSPVSSMASLHLQLNDTDGRAIAVTQRSHWQPGHTEWSATLPGEREAVLTISYFPQLRSFPSLSLTLDSENAMTATKSEGRFQLIAGAVAGLAIVCTLLAGLFGQRSLLWLACYVIFLQLSQGRVIAALLPTLQPSGQEWLIFSGSCATLALAFFFFANYQLMRSLYSGANESRFPDTFKGGLDLASSQHGKPILIALFVFSIIVPAAVISSNSVWQHGLPLYLFVISVFLSLYLAINHDAFAQGHSLLIYVATLRLIECILFTSAIYAYINGHIGSEWISIFNQLLIAADAVIMLILLLLAMQIEQRQSVSGAYSTGKREMKIAAIAPLLNRSKHDLRSPISDIVGLSELVLDAPLNRDQRLNVLEIQQLARTALGRTNQLFSFQSGTNRAIPATSSSNENFSIEDVLIECTQYFLPRDQREESEIIVSLSPQTHPEWHGDHGSLRQALLHIIEFMLPLSSSNPLELNVVTGAQGELVIEARSKSALAKLSLHSKENAETFSVARSLVLQSQGHLDLVTEGEDAICRLSLPLTEVQAGQFLERYNSLLKGMRILFVDDNPTVCKVYTEFANQWEMATFSATDSAQALSIITQQQLAGTPIDFLFIDYLLDEMDGIELARQIKLDPSNDRCTIYLISNAVESINSETAKNCGVRKILEKPLLPMAMKTILVEELIAQKSIEDSVMLKAKGIADNVSALEPLKVLLVEDNPVSVKIVRAMLEKFSLACDVANTSQQAISLFEKTDYPLVLLDCELPDRSGCQTGRLMREIEATSRTETLISALTAHDDAETIRNCHASGMNKHLSKPIDLYQLESIIQRARELQTGKA